MNGEITKKTLERIRDEQIRPETEWHFLLRRSLAWMGIAAAAGIGAWALSMALFPFLSLGTDLPRGGWPRFFLPALVRPMPIVWIVFVAAFVSVAVIEFRRIGHGYRHRVAVIALGILGLVTLLSGILHALRVNEAIDRDFRSSIPSYREFSVTAENFWFRADDGFLLGTVISGHPDGFVLLDPDGGSWTVLVTSKTEMRPRAEIIVGSDLKIVGEQKDGHSFKAEEILPGSPPKFRGNGQENGRELRDGYLAPRTRVAPEEIPMR